MKFKDIGKLVSGLILAGSMTAAVMVKDARAENIWKGNHVDIEGIVSATNGEQIQGNNNGTYSATAVDDTSHWQIDWESSSVPEPNTDDDPIPILELSWGGLKSYFRAEPNKLLAKEILNPGIYIPSRQEPLTNQLIIGSEDGPYWMILHDVDTPEGNLTFNTMATPRIWTVEGHFTNVEMDPAVFKIAWGIAPPERTDNLWWRNFPVKIWGNMDTQTEIDSLYARVIDMNAKPGKESYIVDETLLPAGPGIYWRHNDGGNWTEVYFNVATGEIIYAIIHTRQTGYSSSRTSRHEMLRGLGMGGNLSDPRYGITNTIPGYFNQYDAALIRWYYQKCHTTINSNNQATLNEMY